MVNRNWMEVQSVQVLAPSVTETSPILIRVLITESRALTFKSQVSSLLGPPGKLVTEELRWIGWSTHSFISKLRLQLYLIKLY